MTGPEELYYRRVLFRTRLLGDRLYTPSHFWILERDPGVWRIGLTKFASRMLGEIVEVRFDSKPGDRVSVGDTIGSFEGFKAISELYSVASGEFLEVNPLLDDRIAVVDDDRYRRGWLYEVRGTRDPQAMPMHDYAGLLDRTIDRLQQSRREPVE